MTIAAPAPAPREMFPFISVDVAVFSVDPRGLRVLLVRRAREPAISQWALPGGALRPHQDANLDAAAKRVLRYKIAVDIPHIEQVGVFSGPGRDPRGWSIAILFAALLPQDQIHALVHNHVEAVDWAPVSQDDRTLAFDHTEQLAVAAGYLRSRVENHVLPLHLMPAAFTLTELQRTCEAILGHPLDKSAFRRRLKCSADLEELADYQRGAQRPAQLYRARDGFEFMG
jgi:8-oxo-dGTP diphosphatase